MCISFHNCGKSTLLDDMFAKNTTLRCMFIRKELHSTSNCWERRNSLIMAATVPLPLSLATHETPHTADRCEPFLGCRDVQWPWPCYNTCDCVCGGVHQNCIVLGWRSKNVPGNAWITNEWKHCVITMHGDLCCNTHSSHACRHVSSACVCVCGQHVCA